MNFIKKILIFFILPVWFMFCGYAGGANREHTNPGSPGPDMHHQSSPDKDDAKTGLFDGFLYFADSGGPYLKALPKRFPSNLNSHELGRAILGALMEGPSNPALAPTFPPDTRVMALFISEDGKAWVDLGIKDGRLENMDTLSELLAVYSLVNSLTLNIPGVTQVKLLVNGSDVATLGGHVSLEYFYQTNMLIVK